MANLNENEKDTDAKNRNLGEEWEGWKEGADGPINEGKWLFLITASAVIVLLNFFICLFVYLIAPRLESWHFVFPSVAWIAASLFFVVSFAWLAELFLTALTSRNFFFFGGIALPLFDVIFSGAFHLAKVMGVSRDRMGHSFVRAYNEISRATAPGHKKHKLLILLPRCLTKEQLKEINALKGLYPLEIYTVSGGELARRKIKEIRPSAVIGVACERDLISGIRDVGKKMSLIGIPNQRPNGPCQDTLIDMSELIRAIEFYVGPPRQVEAEASTQRDAS